MTFASAIPLFQVRRLGSFTEECVLFARELIISSRTIPYEQTDVCVPQIIATHGVARTIAPVAPETDRVSSTPQPQEDPRRRRLLRSVVIAAPPKLPREKD